MTKLTLTPDERREIQAVLTAQRAHGITNPRLPIFDDIDGDGIPDFYGLGKNGEVVLAPGASLDGEGSCYVSEGGDA